MKEKDALEPSVKTKTAVKSPSAAVLSLVMTFPSKSEDKVEIIGQDVSYKLAQRSPYFVLEDRPYHVAKKR